MGTIICQAQRLCLSYGIRLYRQPAGSLLFTFLNNTPESSVLFRVRIMEAALAAIALATAVKDLVELGHRIHGSFAKVSLPPKNAHKILTTIHRYQRIFRTPNMFQRISKKWWMKSTLSVAITRTCSIQII